MSPSSTHEKTTDSTASGTHLREIKVAHSPDSDDAFMFYGLATNKVRVTGLKFTDTLTDIETLNQKAKEGVYDVTAISFHAYPYIQDKYAIMPTGGSVGNGAARCGGAGRDARTINRQARRRSSRWEPSLNTRWKILYR